MFSRLTQLRDRGLSGLSTTRPARHPDRLPNFEPLVLGTAVVLLLLQVVGGCDPMLWLVPVVLAGLILRPLPRAVPLPSIPL